MKARLNSLRYIPWMLRDLLLVPCGILLLVGLVTGLLARQLFAERLVDDVAAATLASQALVRALNTAVPWLSALAIGGMLGLDLERGYYRSWFSKPLIPWLYYCQRFVLAGLAISLAPLLMGAGIAAALGVVPALKVELFGTAALVYLLVGGATFLVSHVAVRDWIIVGLAVILQQQLASYFLSFPPADGTTPVFYWLWRLLPPFHLLRFDQPLPTGTALTHVLGYGLLVVGVAATCIRFREFSKAS